jgi:transcriptional regulatory protein RtcR
MKKQVVIGLLGTTLDSGAIGEARWERWRPTVAIFQHEDRVFDRLDLLFPRPGTRLAQQIAKDIATVSPGTLVQTHKVEQRDPWDFEEVYASLLDFASAYPFNTDDEEYFVHITTGTHVAQICLFLLAETRRFPAKLIQTSPGQSKNDPVGSLRIIDLDLAKYDSIAARHRKELEGNIAGLKHGIKTRNPRFNRMIEELEHVAAHSTDPILLTGPTGAGKTHLARRIYDLRKHRRQVTGAFVEVNCATLRGDAAMSALFGHKRGAYTGAATDRPGLLRAADEGLLFLDEIGELGLDEQAMLLRAIEEKRFLPLGADTEVTSNFQLMAGTNRDLVARVREGSFREDLLARINLWTFALPALRDRREDIEPNLDFELARFSERQGRVTRFSAEARAEYLRFAASDRARWPGNFRDLSASVTRMATLAPAGRITLDVVHAEIARLDPDTTPSEPGDADDILRQTLGPAAATLDRFDRVQLAEVLRVCAGARSLSEAGRELFSESRKKKRSANDTDRLRKYLARFGLQFPIG